MIDSGNNKQRSKAVAPSARGDAELSSSDVRRLVVISDLHISSGPLDDCDPDLESALVDFLTGLSTGEKPVELVINGDFLDFVQAEPWEGGDLRSRSPNRIPLCFTEEQSLSKAQSICAAHLPVFRALGSFLAKDSGNRLVILPGNHDPDFFWPGVQDFVRRIVAGDSRPSEGVHFHLNQVYHPPGHPGVWIEHGHQHDPCNDFRIAKDPWWGSESPPILKDVNGHERLLECVGTRFLLKFLNRLDRDYPFVDNVKPFSRFLRIFGVSAVPGAAPLKAMVAVWSMMRFIGQSVLFRPLDLLGLPEAPDRNLLEEPGLLFSRLSASEQSKLQRRLGEVDFQLDRPLHMFVADKKSAQSLLDFLADHMEILEGLHEKHSALLGVGGPPGTLTLAKSFALDETALLRGAAKEALRSDSVEAVVMGHTHEPVRPSSELAYVNTGSWTRTLDFRRGDKPSSWSLLRGDAQEAFPYELNYAEIDCGELRFCTYRKKDNVANA